jgi:hypothetical protein
MSRVTNKTPKTKEIDYKKRTKKSIAIKPKAKDEWEIVGYSEEEKEKHSSIQNLFGNKSWAKRTNETMLEYSVFNQYLSSPIIALSDWVRSITKEEMKQFGQEMDNPQKLRKKAILWRWHVRKNDFINQAFEMARHKDSVAIKSIGEQLHDATQKITGLVNHSLDKAIENGDLIPIDKIMDFIVKLADLKIQKDDLEERRRISVNMSNVPTDKLKQLLSEINVNSEKK